MPEVYTLRAAENFGNSYNHRPLPVIVNHNRNLLSPHPNSNEQSPRSYYLKSEYDKQTSLNKLAKPPSPRVQDKSNYPNTHRLSPILSSERRNSPILHQSSYEKKPEMYYLKAADAETSQYGERPPYTNNDRQQRKLNDDITHSDQRQVTTYTLIAPKRENPPYIQHSSSPPIRSSLKKQPVSFNLVDENDVSNEQHRSSTIYRDAPMNNHYPRSSKSKASESIQRSMNNYYPRSSKSKASESIQRSMNKYRFFGS